MAANHKRLFIGIPLPVAFVEELEYFRNENNMVSGIRWTKSENLHITLCFIGDYEVDKIPDLCHLIHHIVKDTSAFTLDFAAFKFGPHYRKAYMIWTTFHPNDDFKNVYLRLHKEITGKEEKRDPIPHITLCRFKKIDKDSITLNFPVTIDNLYIDTINLYESVLHKTGAEYAIIDEFKLN